ncbi:protein of unknown function [Pseudarcicella hirudinis]|uniref:DUF4180 domain-containing protein n=1 Tax=Pseudarcicella hirudinis TaxID=1079859 RepID=A0A1I5SVS2_9BACT|nr:DUF4180 domain-containing protein [Pseudarcicella hirudinis]SFP74872.1 protein of unknown function [Pseudarcicella hirudinis]
MKIELAEINNTGIAEIISDNIEINNTQEALDIMANCSYQGADGIILHEKNLIPDFFDLKTGLAGEILQKFSNYRVKLAIVGEFSKYQSKSLKDFIYESNKSGRVYFVNSVTEAKQNLSKI